jgi:hypothetical protein
MAAEVLAYSNAISTQYNHVPDVWAACDGLKLMMQATLDNIGTFIAAIARSYYYLMVVNIW